MGTLGITKDTILLRHRRFASNFARTLNSHQAAKYAGYKHPESQGQSLLRNPRVLRLIEEERQGLIIAEGVTRDRIMAEMAVIAFSDPADYFTWDGQEMRLKGFQEMPDGARRAIKKIKVHRSRRESGREHEPWVDETIEVEFWDKNKALDMFNRTFGHYGEERRDGVLTGMAGILVYEKFREEILHLVQNQDQPRVIEAAMKVLAEEDNYEEPDPDDADVESPPDL